MKCVSCGFENRSGVIYCENCGEKLRLAAQTGAKANGRSCPKCGNKVKTGVKFCDNCGAKIPVVPAGTVKQTTKYCPECGTQVREGTKFCENCGKALGTTKVPSSHRNQTRSLEQVPVVPQKKPRWRRNVGWGAAAALLVFLFGFWSEIIPVKAIPITASPILAVASNQLAALQANLPRPAALENAVGNQRGKAIPPGELQPVAGNNGIPKLLGCGVDVDLSVSNVTEAHFFVENSAFNPSRLIYSIKNNSKSLSDYPYGFHVVWYVHDKLGQDENSIEGKQYSCSTEANGTISCMVPDWRGAISARMNVFSNDPACPLPLDVFVFGNGYAFPKEQKANLCTPFSLGSPEVSVPTKLEAGVKKEVDFCFNTTQDLPPKTGFYDDFIMDVTIGNVSSTVFPFRENNRRICYAYKDYSGEIKEKTPFKWSVYDFRCWNVAVAGNISIDGPVAAVTVQGASGGDVQVTEEQICEMAPLIDTASAKFIRNFNEDNTEYYIYSFTFKLKSKVPSWDDEIKRYVIAPEINKPGYSPGYDHCVLDATRTQLVCSNLVFAQNYPGTYFVEFWNNSGSTLLCRKTVYTGAVSLPGITQEAPEERCEAFTSLDISVVPIGWQKDGSYLLYFKMPGGIPGLTRDMPGDNNPPWKFTVTINYDYPGSCRVETYKDRLVCSFKIPESYGGTKKGVFLYEAGCTQNLYWFIDIPSLIPTPTPTSPPSGCGPEPVTDSTDPAVVKKYHKWCTCKGGSWTSYPDGSGECSVH